MANQHAAEVVRVVEESALDRTYVLKPEDPLTWVPGQYVWVSDPAVPDGKARAYSISSAPRADGRLELTIRAGSTDDITQFGYRVGQPLLVATPEGTFTLAYEASDRLILCGAGSGVAPFRAYVQHVRSLEAPPDVVFVQSDRAPSGLLFHAELESQADEAAWFRYEPRVTGDDHGEPWTGKTGRITRDELAQWIETPERTRVYACGPKAFVDGVLEGAAADGVPADRLHREGWG